MLDLKAVPPSPAPERTDSRRRSNRLLFFLLASLVVLTVAGLVLLGAYFYLSRQAPPADSWVNPVEAVRTDAVAPDLAVLPLAGYDDERVIGAALDAGELETAYAALAHNLLLPDNVRLGHWLLLAERYAPSDPQRAAIAYQAAMDGVALSPALSDMSRAETSLQVATGAAALEKLWLSRLALAQAENVARYSLSLLPAQRRELLQHVISGYRAIGDDQTATSIQQKLDSESSGPPVRLPPAPQVMPTLHGSMVLSPTVVTAVEARQQAALEMAARWFSAATDERHELAEALAQALVAEDSVRTDFYTLADTLSAPDQLSMLHDQIAWLTIKYQVARRGYGISLVPDWESAADQIRADLASAYTELINGYGRELDTLSAAEAASGRVELLGQGVLWTRLGLFPDHAEETLGEQLTAASRALWTRNGGAGLVIVIQETQGERLYLLSGQDTSAAGT